MNLRALRIRIFNWEYWPFTLVYLPVFIYWFWLSLRARSFLYFTAANPVIRNGGMMGESKMDILDKLPSDKIPKTILVEPGSISSEILDKLKERNMDFPLIAKPDMGERGTAVRKIQNSIELEDYRQTAKFNFLLQSFVDLPLEAGVFYFRFPGEQTGRISSVTIKEMLYVTGDGKHTIRELVLKNDRAFLQMKALNRDWEKKWDLIPKEGEKIILQGIGNHCRGTKFLNGNHLINDQMVHSFDRIADAIPGFHFGRFDLRAASPDDLRRGDFLIMELNGAGAEPSHIYDPSISLSEAYASLLFHWKTLFHISVNNHKAGIPYLSFREGLREYRKVLENQRLIEQV